MGTSGQCSKDQSEPEQSAYACLNARQNQENIPQLNDAHIFL